MKKNLLFSLLLGSAFTWMNEVYAADTAAAPAAEEAKSAGDKADAPKVEEAKKYKVPSVTSSDGATYKPGPEVELTYHKESDKVIYDTVPIMDSSVTQDAVDQFRKLPKDKFHSGPFVPGQELPKGYKVVNVWVKKDSSAKDDPNSKLKGLGGNMVSADPEAILLQIEGAAGNTIGFPDGYDIPADHNWALMNDKNEVFIPEVKLDPAAESFYGDLGWSGDPSVKLKSQAFTRFFKIPNEEATAKLQDALKKAADLEEKLKSAGTGGGSPEDAAKVKELETQIEELKKNASSGAAPAVDPSAPLTKTFQFEGMNFVIITSDPAAKSHPELFEELKSNLYKLFSIQPKVGTAIAAMMLKNHESLDGSQGEFVKILVADAYKLMGSDKTINLVAELQFPTEVAYKDAYAYVESLKNKYNRDDAIREATQPVSAEEAARRQAEHEAELAAERSKAEIELAAERAKGEEILAQLEQITKEKAAAEAEKKLAEAEKEKAIQQRNIAVEVGIEIASSAIDQADQKAQEAAQNAQIAAHNAQIAAQKASEVKSAEDALNESELEKQKALNEAEAEKARLAAAHQQTQAALEETKNDLMETKISEATLTAKHDAAKEAAEKAEKEAAAVKEQLKDAHGALLDVATSTSNSTETVTAEHVAQDPVDANVHDAPIEQEEQVTAAALTASAPLPLSNSMVITDKKTASIIPDIHNIAPTGTAVTAAAG